MEMWWKYDNLIVTSLENINIYTRNTILQF